MSDRAAVAMLHTKLARYRETAWRRDQPTATCPAQQGQVEQVMWMILKVRDRVPSEMTIHRALGYARRLRPTAGR
jgi:hypothetical protein